VDVFSMDVITDYELKKYGHSVEQMFFLQYRCLRAKKNSIQNTKCKKEYVKPKVVNGDMGRRTKMITEYRQTGRDVNGQYSGDWVGMGTKYFTVSSSLTDLSWSLFTVRGGPGRLAA